jgi:broad specificity phosphatase PhoE
MNTIQKVWLVRHGLREDHQKFGVAESRRIHIDDPQLSEYGKKQAKELAEHFVNKKVEHIFCSPFLRCLQTAEPVATRLNLPLNIEYGIRESFTEFNREPKIMTPEEMCIRFPKIDKTYASRVNPTFPETLDEMFARVELTIKNLMNEFKGNLLFVGHEWSTIAGTRGLLNKTDDELPLACPPAGVFELQRHGYHSNDWKMSVNAEISHLSDPKKSFSGEEENEINLWLKYHNLNSLDELSYNI